MRVLVVARCKERGYAPFVAEQVAALRQVGVDCAFFPVKSKGVLGYLRHRTGLKRAIKEYKPDILHAHYGLCGLLANLQRTVPVVTTYHGSDINDPKVRGVSRIAMRLSRFNVFVSQGLIDQGCPRKDYALIPCGIDLAFFPNIDKAEARRQRGLKQDGRYVLFAGAFDNPVKNASLAKDAVAQMSDVVLLELKGYSRSEVAVLMQAVDAFLMTSFTEGSPQVIKEALACGCPIVSVDVGDVKERVNGVDGCFVVDADVSAIAEALRQAVLLNARTNGRQVIERDGLTAAQVAEKLRAVYRHLLEKP